ncbi:TPA: hypothetical protein R4O11_001730 [Campylobacter jejuni]|nr:hypothetical protein [Campylobacter jejuni]
MIAILSDFIKFLGIENKYNNTNNTKQTKKEETILKETIEILDKNEENIKYHEEVEIIQEGINTKEIIKEVQVIEKNGQKIKKEKIKEILFKKI